MKLLILPIILLFLLCTATASADDCDSLEVLRQNATSYFDKIRTKSIDDTDYETSFTLPNATSCKIILFSASASEYQCEWFIVQDTDPQHEFIIRREYEEIIDKNIIACLHGQLRIKKTQRVRGGETTTIYDTAGNIPPGFERTISVTRRFFSHWWTLEMGYFYGK